MNGINANHPPLMNDLSAAGVAYRRAHAALHTVWTKAVGTEGYDKRAWQELDNAILSLARVARGEMP